MAVVLRPKTTTRTHLTVRTAGGTAEVTADELLALVKAGTHASCPVCGDDIIWCPTATKFAPALSGYRAVA